MTRLVFINENIGYAMNTTDQTFKTIDGGNTWSIIDNNNNKFQNIYYSNNTIYFTGWKGAISKISNNELINLNGGKYGLSNVLIPHVKNNNNSFEFFQTGALPFGPSQPTYYKTNLNIDNKNITTAILNINQSNVSNNRIIGSAYNPSKTVEITFPKPYRAYNNSLEYQAIFDSSNTNTDYEFNDLEFYDDNSAFGVSNDRLLKTTNQGNTWQTIVMDDENDIGNRFTDIHMFDNNSMIIAGRLSKLYKTTDGGQTWTVKTLSDDTSKSIERLYFVNNQIGFAFGNNTTLYKTTDGGNTWTDILNNFSGEIIQDVQFINQDEGWYMNNGKTFHTTNGGTTWIQDLGYFPVATAKFRDNKTGFGWNYDNSTLYKYVAIPKCPQINSANVYQENGKYKLNVSWTPTENATNYNVSFYVNNMPYNDYTVGKTENNFFTFDVSDFYYLSSYGKFGVKVYPVNSQYENQTCNNYDFTVLGVSENQQKYKVNIYPNPVEDFIHFKTDKNIDNVVIYSMEGKKIKESKNSSINIKELIKGIYIIEIRFKDFTFYSTKFIKK